MWNILMGSGGMTILILLGVVLLVAGLIKKLMKLVFIGLIIAVAAVLLTGGLGILGF